MKFLFLIFPVLFNSCSMNLKTTKQIIDVFAIEEDSTFIYFFQNNDKSILFKYNPQRDHLIKYELDSGLFIRNPFFNKKGELIAFTSTHLAINAYLSTINLESGIKILDHMPFGYKEFTYSSITKLYYAAFYIPKKDNFGNETQSFRIDAIDSVGNVVGSIFQQKGNFVISNGVTKDNRFLIYYFWDESTNSEGDCRCIAIDVLNPSHITDLRDKQGRNNDKNPFSQLDMYDADPSRFSDSIYVFKYGKPDVYLFSASTGNYRYFETLSFDEEKYFAAGPFSEMNSLPFQALVAEGNLLLIRNTENGKVKKIEPDRKPDEVIPLKIINPEKME